LGIHVLTYREHGNVTSLFLLLCIAGGILLQLAIYLGISFWRHWLDYLTLQGDSSDLRTPAMPFGSDAEPQTALAAWSGWRTFKVTRKVYEDQSQSVCSFYLVPQDGLALPPFLPGQFLTFHLEIPKSGGVSEQVVRCYSLSDAPRPDGYRVSIKRAVAPLGSAIPPGRSSNYFHDQIDVGSLLQVRSPAGHFHIDQSAAPLVLISGGIGITPLLSMLTWCLAEQSEREVWLFCGVRHSQQLVLQSELEAWSAQHANFHLVWCFSNPHADDLKSRPGACLGRVDVDLLRRQLPLKPYHFYICGPTPMLESLVPALQNWGVPDERIHYEAFGPASIAHKSSTRSPPTTPDQATGAAISVSFERSGKHFPWHSSAGTLLDFAETNGIAVTSGCRAGGCGSCQTTILAGQVSYRQTPDFDPEPGTCLLCVCTPKTDLTLEL
jgi:ferredoxin-NADP reductase